MSGVWQATGSSDHRSWSGSVDCRHDARTGRAAQANIVSRNNGDLGFAIASGAQRARWLQHAIAAHSGDSSAHSLARDVVAVPPANQQGLLVCLAGGCRVVGFVRDYDPEH